MIFMTQKTAKGDNKIYEEMDKHFHIHSRGCGHILGILKE